MRRVMFSDSEELKFWKNRMKSRFYFVLRLSLCVVLFILEDKFFPATPERHIGLAIAGGLAIYLLLIMPWQWKLAKKKQIEWEERQKNNSR